MLEIAAVDPEGTAARLGIRAGEHIVSINGREIGDVIDFRFQVADERISLVVQKGSGKRRRLTVRKPPDDDLGLAFGALRIRRCRNRCLFCFVDQMPKGCRPTLYIKDDDYRASFLHGNYITLGNLGEEDWKRIFEQRLSPLYISVHATDTALRRFILGNRNAPDILEQLKRLAAGGIWMHTQIVLCPGINDGDALIRSIEELGALHPAVRSIAVVPAGVTAYRKGLPQIGTFSRTAARNVIEAIERLGRRFKRRMGTRLVYASDELLIKAGADFPPVSSYEDLAQIENGVGMVAAFRDDMRKFRLPRAVRPVRLLLVTGASFAPLLRAVCRELRGVEGLRARVVAVTNRFFGPSVTVAGLLSGRDIAHALQKAGRADLVVIPASSLKEGEDVFLDNMSLRELERQCGSAVHAAGTISELFSVIAARGVS